jgi:hypothetical protein
MMAGRSCQGLPAIGNAGLSLRVGGRKIRPRNLVGECELRKERSDRRSCQEKRRFGVPWLSVLKLTQVGEASSLRRSGEPRRRNSAKWFRTFGRRIALCLVKGAGGRSESALATVYQKHRSVLSPKDDVYRLTPARCRKVKGKG